MADHRHQAIALTSAPTDRLDVFERVRHRVHIETGHLVLAAIIPEATVRTKHAAQFDIGLDVGRPDVTNGRGGILRENLADLAVDVVPLTTNSRMQEPLDRTQHVAEVLGFAAVGAALTKVVRHLLGVRQRVELVLDALVKAIDVEARLAVRIAAPSARSLRNHAVKVRAH